MGKFQRALCESVYLNLVTGPFEKKAFAFPFFFSLAKCRSLLHLQGKEGDAKK